MVKKRQNSTINAKLKTRKKISFSSRSLQNPSHILALLLVVGLATWLAFAGSDRGDGPRSKVSYVTNENNIVCVLEGPTNLSCEDLESRELYNFDLPKKYQAARNITASPDGTKLLIDLDAGGVVVTDTNLNKISSIYRDGELNNRRVLYSWVDGSSQILTSEIKRESNDADFLPAPLVVKILDIRTGESRRVYKTGELADVESIEVLGGNDEYIFITLATVKNWVAEDVDQPPPTLNAVRLSDGLVNPVNTHQIGAGKIYYDSNKDIFIVKSHRTDDLGSGYTLVANLEDSEFGLVLKKVLEFDADTGDSFSFPILTTKGIYSTPSSESGRLKIVDGNGVETELQLPISKYSGSFLSLQSLPGLPISE